MEETYNLLKEVNEFYPFIGYIIIGLLAAFIGSFLNVVIYRLPKMIDFELAEQIIEHSIEVKEHVNKAYAQGKGVSLSLPRSRCGYCNKTIPWYHNIPILSYLILKGKCYNCQTSFSAQYMMIELFHTVSWIALFYLFGISFTFIILAIAFSLCLSMAMIDLEHKILPDSLVFMLYGLGLLFSTQKGALLSSEQAIIESIGAFVICHVFIQIYSFIRGKVMMGFGDVKLITAFVSFIGLFNLLFALLAACILGIAYYIFLSLSKRLDSDNTFAFGPFICVGCFAVLVFNLL